MDTSIRPARALLAAALIILGILGFIYGDFAPIWQRIPIENLPSRVPLSYLTALIELFCGIGLLLKPTLKFACLVLLPFLILWTVLLRLPAVIAVPSMEATWLGAAEIAVITAGGWCLYAAHTGGPLTGERGVRIARWMLILSLPAIGLAHFFYADQTAGFVPAWIGVPYFWTYLTGAGSLAACLGLAFNVFPRLAATLEAAMLGAITLGVWGAGPFLHPTDRMAWTGLTISSAIAIGAWLVADTYRSNRWLGTGKSAAGITLD